LSGGRLSNFCPVVRIKRHKDNLYLHKLIIHHDLQKLCKEIVAEIDGSILEGYRLGIQRAQELLSSPRKEAQGITPAIPTTNTTTKKP
jgi:hypothetical protein